MPRCQLGMLDAVWPFGNEVVDMRKSIVAALFLAMLFVSASADAQHRTLLNSASYRYSGGPLSNMAATPQDWLVIKSTSKSVTVTHISICGIATAPGTVWVNFILRSTADSAGTSSNTVPSNISANNVPPTGSLAVYTANPTAGTSAGVVDTKPLNVGPGGGAGCIFQDYGTRKADPPFLRGAPVSLAINLGGATNLPAGLALSYTVETIEQ